MGIPKNPKTIILRNVFYQKGITEGMIWDYYKKRKGEILREVGIRRVMLFLITPEEKIVVRRNIGGNPLFLTNKTYDEVLSGRTISIHSTMEKFEDIFIVDVDFFNWNGAKIATNDIYESLLNFSLVRSMTIRFTGKESFHIFCRLYKKINIDTSRYLFENHLSKDKNIINKYSISPRRRHNVPNIDLWASNKVNGNFITLHSLSIMGLKCMEVNINNLLRFEKRNAIIK